MRAHEARSPRLLIYSVGGKVTIFIQDFRPKAKIFLIMHKFVEAFMHTPEGPVTMVGTCFMHVPAFSGARLTLGHGLLGHA